jgi:hypothetical protein
MCFIDERTLNAVDGGRRGGGAEGGGEAKTTRENWREWPRGTEMGIRL